MKNFDLIFTSEFGRLVDLNIDRESVRDFFADCLGRFPENDKLKIVLGRRAELFLREVRLLENFETYFSLDSTNLIEQCKDALLSSTGPSLVIPLTPLSSPKRTIQFLEEWKRILLDPLSMPDCFASEPNQMGHYYFLMSTKGKTKLKSLLRDKKSISTKDFHWSFPQNMAKQEHLQRIL